jgi:hypothetical protein
VNFDSGSSIPSMNTAIEMRPEIMSSNSSSDMERLRNPTHFGGDGLCDAPHTEEANTLKVSVSDHLDASTRSLVSEPTLSFARRNRLPMLFAFGGVVWLLVSLARRSVRG